MPVTIDLTSCNRAAEILVAVLGEEAINNIVGGRKWWTVRGLDGVEGEWVAMRADLNEVSPNALQPVRPKDSTHRYPAAMDKLHRVMVRSTPRIIIPIAYLSL